MDEFERAIFPDVAGEPDAAVAAHGIVEFSTDAYIKAFPEVEVLIESGEIKSAADHYLSVGHSERRLELPRYLYHLAGSCVERPSHGAIAINYDAVLRSESGFIFVVGWIDDRVVPLLSMSFITQKEGWNSRAIARCRRPDAEQAVGASGHHFGMWMLERAEWLGDDFIARDEPLMLRCRLADGRFSQTEVRPRVVSDTEMRETVLGHFAHLSYSGNRDLEAFKELDRGVGASVLDLNRRITAAISRTAHVEHFGPARPRFSTSYVVCLFGKHEYFFLQSALFAAGARGHDVEFIYVSNSPELTEVLHKEAQIAERIYGLSITLVILSGNAGFSAANNAAARAARSRRLVFINPDVFPRDDSWAARLEDVLATQPTASTRLFGAPLYYDDGSLMHGGMYFEIDRGLSVSARGVSAKPLIRVEHYGKGAPAWSDTYSATRPVPAITGAFVSIDRDWFEHLGGFSEDYVFGHYEDADLCLRSLEEGVPAWLQDVRFWHLEGKGSTRRPVHEGGTLVNRWLFTHQWGDLIQSSIAGRKPSHPLLNPAPIDPPPPIQPAPDPVQEWNGLRSIAGRLARRARAGLPPSAS